MSPQKLGLLDPSRGPQWNKSYKVAFILSDSQYSHSGNSATLLASLQEHGDIMVFKTHRIPVPNYVLSSSYNNTTYTMPTMHMSLCTYMITAVN